MALLPDERERVQVVSDDLAYLISKWDHSINESSLRISSPILYRLLVEHQLARAADSLSIQVMIMAPTVCEQILKQDLSKIPYWQAGGGRSGNIVVEGARITIGNSVDPASEFAQIAREFGTKVPYRVSRFGSLPSFVLAGVVITKEEVIKYVTDKLGGRHFDPGRGEGRLQDKYRLLDGLDSTRVAEKKAVYYELVSIGQSLASSQDVRSFVRRAKDVLD